MMVSIGSVSATVATDMMGIGTFAMISNKQFIDTTDPNILLSNDFIIWPNGVIHLNYSMGNQTFVNKDIYQVTAITFVPNAVLTITYTNGTQIFTGHTYQDNLENQWKYKLGQGYTSMIITAVFALIGSIFIIVALFWKRQIILWGQIGKEKEKEEFRQ